MRGFSDVDQLIAKATAGDAPAIESLLMRYHDEVLHSLRAQLGGRRVAGASAEDALQETFIEVFRRIKTLDARGEAAFLSWLKTIARTRLSNMLKAQRAAKRGGDRRQIRSGKNDASEKTATTILGLIAGQTPTPSVILRRKEANLAMQEAIDSLEPLKKQILDWRYGQGMAIESIAAKTGKKASAVKMIIHRCLADLRENLNEKGDFTRGM